MTDRVDAPQYVSGKGFQPTLYYLTDPSLFSHASGSNIHGGVFISYNNQVLSSRPPSPHGTTFKSNNVQTLNSIETYAWLLLPQGRGYPLWKPKVDSSYLPEIYKQDGVHFGDVGFLNEFGGFEFLFNACHPADHPLNIGGVPPDFEYLDLDPTRISDSQEEYNPGSFVTSDSSHFCRSQLPSCGKPPPGVPREVGAGISFNSSATTGALLILPEGAKRSDHQQYNNFAAYAAKHAYSWYKYANDPPLARGIPNGALYLITGYDKARAWGVASFKNALGKVSLEFVPKVCEEGLPKYWFQKCDFASHDANGDHVFGNQSGSVFIRGFKIALQKARNPFVPVYAKVQKILELDAEELLPTKIVHSNDTQQSGLQQVSPAHLRHSHTPFHQFHPQSNNHGLNFDFPTRHQVYHPSDGVNRWILNNCGKVDVAITHDNVWASVIHHEEEIPSDEHLIQRIRKRFRINQTGLNHAFFETPIIGSCTMKTENNESATESSCVSAAKNNDNFCQILPNKQLRNDELVLCSDSETESALTGSNAMIARILWNDRHNDPSQLANSPKPPESGYPSSDPKNHSAGVFKTFMSDYHKGYQESPIVVQNKKNKNVTEPSPMKTCFTCGVTETVLWRRSKENPGKYLCNRCGLWERNSRVESKSKKEAHFMQPLF